MPFPRPESYKTHKGPKGSSAEWSAKAAKLLQSKQSTETEVAESLRVFDFREIPGRSALKRAFRLAVLKAHPDHGGSDEEFIKIRKAFETLFQRCNHA